MHGGKFKLAAYLAVVAGVYPSFSHSHNWTCIHQYSGPRAIGRQPLGHHVLAE
jgi:hypothetical protein